MNILLIYYSDIIKYLFHTLYRQETLLNSKICWTATKLYYLQNLAHLLDYYLLPKNERISIAIKLL